MSEDTKETLLVQTITQDGWVTYYPYELPNTYYMHLYSEVPNVYGAPIVLLHTRHHLRATGATKAF